MIKSSSNGSSAVCWVLTWGNGSFVGESVVIGALSVDVVVVVVVVFAIIVAGSDSSACSAVGKSAIPSSNTSMKITVNSFREHG